MKKNILNMLKLSAVVLTLSACSTPQPVLELAEKTAINVSIVNSHLKNLAADNNNLSLARSQNIAHLKEAVREIQKRHALDMALTEKTDPQSITKKQELATWLTQIRAAARNMTVQQFDNRSETQDVDPFSADVQDIMGSLQSYKPDSEKLAKTAEILATLSKEDSVSGRLKFMQAYIKEVKADIDKNKKDANQASAEAITELNETTEQLVKDVKGLKSE